MGKKNNTENTLKMYGVVYLGGHPSYPQKKHGEISFIIMDDRFNLQPTFTTKKWFNGFSIPFDSILNLR